MVCGKKERGVWVLAYESPDGQTRRDGGDGACADVARYPAAGGQEGEEEGVRGGVVLGFGFLG